MDGAGTNGQGGFKVCEFVEFVELLVDLDGKFTSGSDNQASDVANCCDVVVSLDDRNEEGCSFA